MMKTPAYMRIYFKYMISVIVNWQGMQTRGTSLFAAYLFIRPPCPCRSCFPPFIRYSVIIHTIRLHFIVKQSGKERNAAELLLQQLPSQHKARAPATLDPKKKSRFISIGEHKTICIHQTVTGMVQVAVAVTLLRQSQVKATHLHFTG